MLASETKQTLDVLKAISARYEWDAEQALLAYHSVTAHAVAKLKKEVIDSAIKEVLNELNGCQEN